MFSYQPLMQLLAKKGMTTRELMFLADISPNTMTKIRHDEEVSMSILTKICSALKCSYGDIVEYTALESEVQ